MAEEEDLSTETGTDDEETESGTEAGDSEGESSKTAEPPMPPPTELHNSALFMAKYLDQKLDRLFAATEKITADMAEMEKRITLDLTTKIEATQNALTMRIVKLETLTLEHGVKLQQQDNKGGQQSHQLDELQNQEGAEAAVKGTETPGGTESDASGGTGEGSGSGSETGTESDATDAETTDGDETEGEEDADVE